MQVVFSPGAEIKFEGANNFRELGGYRAADGRQVKYGLLYRGGNLDLLKSEADHARLASLGLREILDLRSAGESAAHPDPAVPGAHYQRVCGMRNADGTGVMAGLTHVCNVHGYLISDGVKIPDSGRLTYRSMNVVDIINGCRAEGRFGFEEVVDGLGAYRKEFVVNRHADAFLTSSHAERATEFNLPRGCHYEKPVARRDE